MKKSSFFFNFPAAAKPRKPFIKLGRVGIVLVMQQQVLKGLITNRNVNRALGSDNDYKTWTAVHIMSTQSESVSSQMRSAEAEQLMCSKKAMPF
jgi:predicted transcriptional regulator